MNKDALDEALEAMEERAAFYRLLASLYFQEVSDAFIERLRAVPRGLEEMEGPMGEGYRQLRRYFAHRGPDPRTDLACDYARVFLAAGMFEGDAGCPFESIYTSEEKLVMQGARDEVRSLFLSHGVEVNRELHLPEDHLSFELEFLAILSDRARVLLRDGRWSDLAKNLATQRTFIDDHLLNWLGALQDRVDELSRQDFYPAITRIVRGYLEHDRAFLEEAVVSAQDRALAA